MWPTPVSYVNKFSVKHMKLVAENFVFTFYMLISSQIQCRLGNSYD